MKEEKRQILIEKAQSMQKLLGEIVDRLERGEEVNFGEVEKGVFDFVAEVNSGRLQSLLDELQRGSEQARQKLVELFSQVTRPGDTEKPEAEKAEGVEDDGLLGCFGLTRERIDMLLNEAQSGSQKARQTVEELAGEVTTKVKPWLDTLAKTGSDVLGKIASMGDKLSGMGKDLVKERVFTSRFNARVREEFRKRDWNEDGIDTALAVFYQVLSETDDE